MKNKRSIGVTLTVMFLCFCVIGFMPAGYGQKNNVSGLSPEMEKNIWASVSKAEKEMQAQEKSRTQEFEKNFDEFISQLKNSDSHVRLYAAYTLGEIKDPRAVGPLIAVLNEPIPKVRLYAAIALGNIKDSRAVEPLIVALKDSNVSVRMGVAQALGKIKDPRAVESLIVALKDSDEGVQIFAAHALEEINDSRTVDILIDYWKKHPKEKDEYRIITEAVQ